MNLLRSAFVIARRDFSATVFSRSFLLFLLGPLLAIGFGILIGQVADRSDQAALRPTLAVLATPEQAGRLRAGYDAVAGAVGADNLPTLRVEPLGPRPMEQVHKLAVDGAAVLFGLPDAPHLIGSERAVERAEGLANLLVGPSGTPPRVPLAKVIVQSPQSSGEGNAARHVLARGGQSLLFMLTVLLAGMLLSNLVEEKSNKVIEVLASAAPVDAIFLGKLLAMLAVSMTGITLWGVVLAIGAYYYLPVGTPLPIPGVGWPAFVALILCYYVMNYMILGGAFLGIGAQASSVREVQTLSMPVTMAQLAVFALASTAVGDLSRPVVVFASIFPLSSPLTMIARAAQEGGVLIHLLALAWQALWVAIIVRFAAQRFRRGVLKSGAPAKAR